jgi:hypothetical protein
MTRNERIEAMARAYWQRYAAHHYDECMLMPPWDELPDYMTTLAVSRMEAALDAADVEGMVRRAASEGIDLGWDACETRMPEDEFREKRDAIVRRVIGGGQ